MILASLQIVLIAAALYGFNQNWHVEEERPIGSGEDYGAGAPGDGTPLPPDATRPSCDCKSQARRSMPEVGLEPTSP